MCPRAKHSVRVEQQDGFTIWIPSAWAKQWLKDGLVRVVSTDPLVMRQLPSVRSIYSTRYLEDNYSQALLAYKDELIKIHIQWRTGKPPRDQVVVPVQDDNYVPLPHGYGRHNGE